MAGRTGFGIVIECRAEDGGSRARAGGVAGKEKRPATRDGAGDQNGRWSSQRSWRRAAEVGGGSWSWWCSRWEA